MTPYLSDLDNILKHGIPSSDRTGTGTLSLFGLQTRYDLSTHFPAVTTKKLAFKSCKAELLWMIEGSGDERRLAEITHGSRDSGNTIWTGNAQAPYWKSRAKFPGDLGRVYGVQWRHWQCAPRSGIAGIWDVICGTHHQVDQLHHLIQGLKNDSNGRRHVLTAWNPAELDLMALPPCHMFAQFYVREGRLSCQMYQRSADFFLGVPFNIASYSLLTHMIAQVCGLQVGEFIHVIGDAHIYLNHIPQVTEQLSRIALAPSAVLQLTPNITNIDEFTMSDIHLINYDSYGGISATMAV